MRLILIRHGETLWNEAHKFQGFSDIALSSKGRSQAQSLAESLKEETLAAIYTSPLIRARLTAEQIARYHDCPVVIDEGLKELNQGQLEGLTAEDLKRSYPEFLKNWIQEPESTPLPQGESLGDLQRRAWDSIGRIVRFTKLWATTTTVPSGYFLTIFSIESQALRCRSPKDSP